MNGQPSESASIIKGFVTHFTNHFPDMKVIRVDERFTKWQFNPCLITD
jgi:putative Holliday junction resolvase